MHKCLVSLIVVNKRLIKMLFIIFFNFSGTIV